MQSYWEMSSCKGNVLEDEESEYTKNVQCTFSRKEVACDNLLLCASAILPGRLSVPGKGSPGTEKGFEKMVSHFFKAFFTHQPLFRLLKSEACYVVSPFMGT